MKKAYLWVALLGVLLAGACASSDGTPVSDEQIAQFTVGKATKAEVVAALGDPQDIRFEGGKQILIYKYTNNPMFTAAEHSEITFIFTDKGTLEDVLKNRGTSMFPSR